MPPAYTSYDFRPDFADIARPGLDRFLNTCSDLLGDAFEYEQRESYAKTFKRSLWRTLKSELRTAQIREGVEPAPPIGSPPGPPPTSLRPGTLSAPRLSPLISKPTLSTPKTERPR